MSSATNMRIAAQVVLAQRDIVRDPRSETRLRCVATQWTQGAIVPTCSRKPTFCRPGATAQRLSRAVIAVSDQSWNCFRVELLNLWKEAMPHRRKSPTERIEVTDQVGKRHVVVRYTETIEASPDEVANLPREEVATEYRLATGRSVVKTGDSTFQTDDGLLQLKAL